LEKTFPDLRSIYEEQVSLSFQGLDTDARIMFEIAAYLSDVYIQVTGIEKRIIPPHRYKQLFTVYDPVDRSSQQGEYFGVTL
jgi:hypothetical protein